MHFLVHIHVFYASMWPELRDYLKSLDGYTSDIWVTMLDNNEELRKRVTQDLPEAHVLIVDNKGYDIGPFVEVLKQVNLNDYEFCIKIHSKRDLQVTTHVGLTDVSGNKWREYLLSFLKPNNFQKCVHAFNEVPQLGMVGHHAILCKQEPADIPAWNKSVGWLREYGLLSSNQNIELSYIAGSMFMCRAHLLAPVKNILSNVEFEVPSREHPSTVSHYAERLLGHSIGAAGYKIQDVFTKRRSLMAQKLTSYCAYTAHSILRFFYQRKLTASNACIIKICKIPVYHKQKTPRPKKTKANKQPNQA